MCAIVKVSMLSSKCFQAGLHAEQESTSAISVLAESKTCSGLVTIV